MIKCSQHTNKKPSKVTSQFVCEHTSHFVALFVVQSSLFCNYKKKKMSKIVIPFWVRKALHLLISPVTPIVTNVKGSGGLIARLSSLEWNDRFGQPISNAVKMVSKIT